MKKKIVRLTESDLVRLVKRIIKEQDVAEPEPEVMGDTDWDNGMVLIQGEDAESVADTLNNLPDNLSFLAVKNCEYADFSDIDLCQYGNLKFVNLQGTPNNLEETVDCNYDVFDESLNLYDFTSN